MISNMNNMDFKKVILSMFMLLPVFSIGIYLDNDSWFLLNHGRYVIEHGFPNIEPFTIHDDFSFVMQQWLFSVCYWWLYRRLGKWGIIVCLYIVGILIEVMLYKICMQLSGNKFYLSVVLTMYAGVIIQTWFLVTRPQVITYLIMLVEIYCLEKYIEGRKKRYLVLLPILSVLQINLHASMWMLLFAFILPYLAESVLMKTKGNPEYKSYPLFITAVFMLVGGFLNPYKENAILYITKSYGNPTINISIAEMQAPDLKSIPGIVFFVTLFSVLLVYILNKKGNTKPRFVLLLAGTILLGLMALKSFPYFLIGGVLPLAYNLRNYADKLRFCSENPRKRAIQVGACAGLLGTIVLVACMVNVEMYDENKDYPMVAKAIQYLKDNEEISDIRLYTGYFEGGYAEYWGIKSYIDARAEVFLKKNNSKEDIFDEYINLQKGGIHYKKFLEKYQFTHILISDSDTLWVYLENDLDYKKIYDDAEYRIYRKQGEFQ